MNGVFVIMLKRQIALIAILIGFVISLTTPATDTPAKKQ